MKKVASLFLIFILCLSQISAYAKKTNSDPLQLNCSSAVLMDACTGQVVYAKNPNKKAYPASITKVLTVYLAAENCMPNEKITAGKTAIDAVPKDSTNIAIDYGEVLTVEQTANAAMLMSANDASNVLAEHVAGDLESFYDMMNETAISFGAKNSHFVNANGLPDPDHYTTALDFAKITAGAVKSEAFMEYMGNVEYTIPPTNKKDEERNFVAKHRMMYMEKYENLGVKGGKTGYTTQAKHTAVTYAEKDGREWVVVVLGAESIGKQLEDTKKLLTYGYEELSTITVSEKQIGTKKKGNITYIPEGEIEIYLTDGMTEADLTYEFNKKEVVVLDKEGNKLGTLPLTIQKAPSRQSNIAKTLLYIALWVFGIVLIYELWRRHKIKKNRRKRRMRKIREQMEQEQLKK